MADLAQLLKDLCSYLSSYRSTIELRELLDHRLYGDQYGVVKEGKTYDNPLVHDTNYNSQYHRQYLSIDHFNGLTCCICI